MVRTLTTVAMLTLATAAQAKETIRCSSSQAPDIVLTLGAERLLNKTVDCISGNFVVDMTPCAPNGSFGLSDPTGSGDLVRIVNRWQDYGDHIGGVASHYMTPTEIFFSGGFTSPDTGFVDHWIFTANRLTGEGKLKVEKRQPGEGEFTYSCSKAAPRL